MSCFAISVVSENIPDNTIEKAGHIIGCYPIKVLKKPKGDGLSCNDKFELHNEIKNPNINVVIVSEVPKDKDLHDLVGQKRTVKTAPQLDSKTVVTQSSHHSIHLDFSSTQCIHLTFNDFMEALV